MIALFHAGVKGIAIHMRDTQRKKLWMRYDIGRMATRAAPARFKRLAAFLAQARH